MIAQPERRPPVVTRLITDTCGTALEKAGLT
jgi:hypothetical protein